MDFVIFYLDCHCTTRSVYIENIDVMHIPNKINTYYLPAREHISILIIINPCII
jgi:hypothetical protein